MAEQERPSKRSTSFLSWRRNPSQTAGRGRSLGPARGRGLIVDASATSAGPITQPGASHRAPSPGHSAITNLSGSGQRDSRSQSESSRPDPSAMSPEPSPDITALGHPSHSARLIGHFKGMIHRDRRGSSVPPTLGPAGDTSATSGQSTVQSRKPDHVSTPTASVDQSGASAEQLSRGRQIRSLIFPRTPSHGVLFDSLANSLKVIEKFSEPVKPLQAAVSAASIVVEGIQVGKNVFGQLPILTSSFPTENKGC